MSQQGRFIVLEGIDGSGTTTQSKRLVEALAARGVSSYGTCEPSRSPVGVLIRQILRKEYEVAPGQPPSWQTMATLFAADRLLHLETVIRTMRKQGVTVVSDRYFHSTVVYQGLYCEDRDDDAWLHELDLMADCPDLTLVLNVTPSVAKARREERKGRPELYEEEKLQERFSERYKNLERDRRGKLVHIDGDPPADVVFAEIIKHVETLLQKGDCF